MESIRAWFERHLADPQVMGLAVVLVAGFFIIFLTGEMLAPVIASIVIAYLLEGLVAVFERNGLPRLAAALLVFIGFMAFMVFVTFALLPLLSRQVTQIFQLLPEMLTSGQEALMRLPQRYPELFSEAQVRDLIDSIRIEALSYGQHVVSLSIWSSCR
jgi:putative permease